MTERPKTPQEATGIGRPPKLTWDVFVSICARIRETGVKYASCEAFGISGNWVVKRVKELAEAGEPQWLELWERSLELFSDNLEMEMHRRAVHGFVKPVFYKGEVVGEVREFSDQLAIALAKATRPEKFRDNLKVDAEVTGGVLVVPGKMTVEEWLASRKESNS